MIEYYEIDVDISFSFFLENEFLEKKIVFEKMERLIGVYNEPAITFKLKISDKEIVNKIIENYTSKKDENQFSETKKSLKYFNKILTVFALSCLLLINIMFIKYLLKENDILTWMAAPGFFLLTFLCFWAVYEGFFKRK